jgi:hypothetical protein
LIHLEPFGTAARSCQSIVDFGHVDNNWAIVITANSFGCAFTIESKNFVITRLKVIPTDHLAKDQGRENAESV